MLPFLKVRKATQDGVITQVRPSDNPEKKAKETPGLEIAMKELCDAHESKDYKAMAEAFAAAFQMLEIEPHEEYPHDEK